MLTIRPSVQAFWFILLLVTLSAAQAAGDSIKLIKASERSYNNHPALALIFSSKLDPTLNYDRYIQVFDAARTQVRGKWILDEGGQVLYFPQVEPEHKYTIQVRRGLPSKDGTQLTNTREEVITTKRIVPSYNFVGKGRIVALGEQAALPIVTVNVPEVDVEFLRIRDDKLVPFINDFYTKNNNYWRNILYQADKLADSVYMQRFTTAAEPNTRTTTNIDLKAIKELTPGMYVAVMKRPGSYRNSAERISYFFVSDIGLHARVYHDGQVEIEARSFMSGQPLADVALEFYQRNGTLSHKVFTSAQGDYSINLQKLKEVILVARKGESVSFLSFREPALDLSEFAIKGDPFAHLEAFLYSNRDLFRPGENMDLSVLLRDNDGQPAPNVPVHLKVIQPDGRELGSTFLYSAQAGYYQHSLAIPADGKTGRWKLEARITKDGPIVGQLYFNVEEFMPERLKLVMSSKQQTLAPGQPWTIQAEGSHLYGAPARGNRFKGVLNVSPNHQPLEQYSKFHFGDFREAEKGYRKELFDVKLNDEGLHRFEVPTDKGFNSPMRYRLTGSLLEKGGRPVVRSIEQTAWPAEAMVGIKPLFDVDNAPYRQSVGFELIRLDSGGKVMPAKGLEVSLIREDRYYYWDYSNANNWQRRYSEDLYPVENMNVDIGANGKATVNVRVQWGGYQLEVKDPQTGLTSRLRFRTHWWGYGEQEVATALPDRVNLSLDQPAYQAADVVKVRIVPPHAGLATLMLESDRLLYKQELKVAKEGTVVSIPLKADWAKRHDLYVSAVVVRPADELQKIAPKRAIGVLHIPMDREARALPMELLSEDKVQPEKDLKIKVKIGKPTEGKAYVTVAAVDTGILNITGFESPDPFDYFFRQRGYGVDVYDLYGRLIEPQDGPTAQLRYGGDALFKDKSASARTKAKVKTVALFSGLVEVDEQGMAKVSLPVPDYNGKLRVMAVGFSRGQFGMAEKDVVVAAPIIAELAMPRFLAFGDRSRLGLDLHNLTEKHQNLDITLTSEGPLEILNGQVEQGLDPDEMATLNFDILAGAAFEVATINLHVQGDDIDITRHWELGVRPGWPGDKIAEYKMLQAGESWSLDTGFANDFLPDTVDATLLISRLPPLNVREHVHGLLRYPYGCLEQTTSSTYPHVFIDEHKARVYGLKAENREKRQKMISAGVQRLSSMQKTTGGFSLWSNSGPEEKWLSAYATHFLLDARDQGFSVPEGMLSKALQRLQELSRMSRDQLAQESYSEHYGHYAFATKAYTGYVLARANKARLGDLRSLYSSDHDQSQSGLPLVHLGIALYLQGDQRRGREAISEGLNKNSDRSRYYADYGSGIRDSAMTIALLAQHKIDVDYSRLLVGLANSLQKRRYLSTQEKLAVFRAADNIPAENTKQAKALIELLGEEEPVQFAKSLYRAVDAKGIKAGLQVESQYDTPLFLAFELTGYHSRPPVTNTERAEVRRSWYDMQGNPIGNRPLRVGESVMVHIEIDAAERVVQGLVEDLIPAGLEVENLNLGLGEGLKNLKINNRPVPELMRLRSSKVKHTEYRDDRFVAAIHAEPYEDVHLVYLMRAVSPGTYLVPATRFEDMYDPTWRALGDTRGVLTVLDDE